MSAEKVIRFAKDDCIDIGATFLESARRISTKTFENAPFLLIFPRLLSLEPFFARCTLSESS